MKSRRSCWKLFTLAAVAVGISLSHAPDAVAAAAPAGASAAKPNIIVILCDDMGYSDLGCMGSELHTPNLDKLAAEGLRYTQFYNVGRCCPTRASILTGLYPHQAGVGHMTANLGNAAYQGELNDSCVTMGTVMKTGGYGTYAIGKWHVVGDKNIKPDGDKKSWPLQRGFDHYYGTITGAGDYYDPGTLTKDNTMISPLADPDYKPKKFYYTDAIGDHAVKFIADHSKNTPEKPLFMYCAFTAAHWPMHAPEEDIAKEKGKYDGGYSAIRDARVKRMKELGLIDPKWDISPQFGDWGTVKNKAWEARCMEVYAAMIDHMDQNVGKIVAELQKTGRLDNTLIFFLQDNGGCQETVGRKGNPNAGKKFDKIAADAVRLDVIPKQLRDGSPVLQGEGVMPGPENTYVAYGEAWANVSNTPFRLYKHYNHEGGISTPLIAHWPAGIPRKGEWEKTPGHLIDIMATCADLGGATYPKELNGKAITPMQGVSLRPTFTGGAIQRDAIYWEHEGNRAMRQGDWKIVAKGYDSDWELYNMVEDRTEMHDLASKMPDKLKAMADQWEKWAVETHVKPYPPKLPTAGGAAKSERLAFHLKPGDTLAKEKTPDIGGHGFRLEIKVAEPASSGVLVAQGGTANGYAVFVKDGKVVFGVQESSKYAEVSLPLPKSPFTAKAELTAAGKMTLNIDGKTASGKAHGVIAKTPIDGLEVGQDLGGLVGPYQASNAFAGKIESVDLTLAE